MTVLRKVRVLGAALLALTSVVGATQTQAEAKPSWAETMKKALEKKQPAGGFPDQPKPRDSGVPKVKKNAF